MAVNHRLGQNYSGLVGVQSNQLVPQTFSVTNASEDGPNVASINIGSQSQTVKGYKLRLDKNGDGDVLATIKYGPGENDKIEIRGKASWDNQTPPDPPA